MKVAAEESEQNSQKSSVERSAHARAIDILGGGRVGGRGGGGGGVVADTALQSGGREVVVAVLGEGCGTYSCRPWRERRNRGEGVRRGRAGRGEGREEIAGEITNTSWICHPLYQTKAAAVLGLCTCMYVCTIQYQSYMSIPI